MQNKVPEPKYLLRSNMGPAYCLSFHLTPTKEHLYAGCSSGNVYIWDLQTNRILNQFDAEEQDPCLAMHITNDDNLLVQHKSGHIRMYIPAESYWKEHRHILLDNYTFCRSKLLSDDVIIVPCKNSNVGLYSTRSGDLITLLNSEKIFNEKNLGEVMAIKPLLLENQQVLITYEVGLLALWDIRAKKVLHCMDIETFPTALDFETTNMRGIIGFPSEKLQIFNLLPDKLIDKSKINLTTPGTSVTSLRQDNKICAVGSWNGRMRLYAWKNLKCLAVINEYKDIVYDIVYSHKEVKSYNCKYLMAAAGLSGVISLWDLYN